MKKKTKTILAFIIVGVVLLGGFVFFMNPLLTMHLLHVDSRKDAGTWYDDPKNWHRAFGQGTPEEVSVVHSYYWGSDHFTHEYIFFFEVKASAEWREAFIKRRNADLVAPSNARCFEVHYEGTPDWFVPGPVENYDVWDRTKYRGSIWMNKTNEHFYFYGVQL